MWKILIGNMFKDEEEARRKMGLSNFPKDGKAREDTSSVIQFDRHSYLASHSRGP